MKLIANLSGYNGHRINVTKPLGPQMSLIFENYCTSKKRWFSIGQLYGIMTNFTPQWECSKEDCELRKWQVFFTFVFKFLYKTELYNFIRALLSLSYYDSERVHTHWIPYKFMTTARARVQQQYAIYSHHGLSIFCERVIQCNNNNNNTDLYNPTRVKIQNREAHRKRNSDNFNPHTDPDWEVIQMSDARN